MMALSGVRSSCDMLARNSDLARFAASARSVSRIYLRLSSTSSVDSLLLGPARQAEIVDRRHQPALAVDQLLLVQLDLGDVGTDRDGAAVAGLQFVDLQPAAVGKLPLEGRAALSVRWRWPADVRDAKASIRSSSDSRGGAGHDVAVRQPVVLLVFGIAHDQPLGRNPRARRIR